MYMAEPWLDKHCLACMWKGPFCVVKGWQSGWVKLLTPNGVEGAQFMVLNPNYRVFFNQQHIAIAYK